MDGQVLRCAQCGQANRVPAVGTGKKAVCGKCGAPLQPQAAPVGKPVDISDANFRVSIASGKHVVDFWAPWCGPCRMIGPILEQMAGERSDVRFDKVNVDDNPRTASEFGVQGIPLLIFFRDGAEKGRLVGAVPRPRIEAAIQQYLG